MGLETDHLKTHSSEQISKMAYSISAVLFILNICCFPSNKAQIDETLTITQYWRISQCHQVQTTFFCISSLFTVLRCFDFGFVSNEIRCRPLVSLFIFLSWFIFILQCRPPLSAGLLVPSMDHNLQTRNRPREGESGSIQLWRASRNPLEACRLKSKQI